jgi:antitoxin VapB
MCPHPTEVFTPSGGPVSLNIEDEETCRLASELAELTGEAMVDAITAALKERLERKRLVQERLTKIRAISERSAAMLRPGPSAVEHGDFLYDERGLPK